MLEQDEMKKLVEEIKRDEGTEIRNGRHVMYIDSEAHETIGIGRLIDPDVPGAGLRDSEVEQMLQNDLVEMIEEVEKNFPWYLDLPGNAKRALINQAFNMGLPRLKTFKNMLASLQEGKFDDAATHALNSKWSQQVGERSNRIAELYRQSAK
tara:strand:+ start:1991 stop:2446 length:456 start_codon:yes stop_codon:yes gene_type:complete